MVAIHRGHRAAAGGLDIMVPANGSVVDAEAMPILMSLPPAFEAVVRDRPFAVCVRVDSEVRPRGSGALVPYTFIVTPCVQPSSCDELHGAVIPRLSPGPHRVAVRAAVGLLSPARPRVPLPAG